MQRLMENVKRAVTLGVATRNTGTYNGTAVNTAGFDGAVGLVLVGDLPNTTTLAVTLEESEDGSTGWAAISGAATVVQTGTAGDDTSHADIDVRLGDRANRKKFIRGVAVVGVANGAAFGVEILLYNPEQAPVVNSPVSVVV